MSDQLTLFDYNRLDLDTRSFIQTKTAEIRVLVKQTAQGIIEIGQRLIEVKERLGHGNFLPWLDKEFGWSQQTASRFMQVAEQFKLRNLSNLDFGPSALYLLASPSTPEPARQEALERAEQGETISHKAAQEIVNKYKAQVNDLTKKSNMPFRRQNLPLESIEAFCKPKLHAQNMSAIF